MHIRRSVQRDADVIVKMAADAAREEGGTSSLDADRIKSHAFGGNSLFESWIALDRPNGSPIGQAVITKSYDFRRGTPTMVLCELYVVPSARRSGLARKLMSCVARRARDLGARELSITTGVENAVAQKFFAAVGARARQDATFMMSADGIEWLAAEGF